MKLVFTALLLLVTSMVMAADDLAAFQATLDRKMTSKTRGYATPFSGIFSISSPDEGNIRTPVLADTALSMVANSYGDRWVYFNKERNEVETDKVVALRQRAVADLPWQSAIVIRREDAPVAVAIYSAVDCGFCRRLEAFLANEPYSYVVFPSSLNAENFPLARDVWCNKDRLAAWHRVMIEEADIPKVASCPSYPIADIRYTGALFSYGNTPGIFFADGGLLLGVPETPETQALFRAQVDARIERGILFDVR